MIENKFFAGGGLNQDVDENFLKPNDWTNALNIRNTDKLDLSDGVISNVKGNSLVTYSLPSGTNKCIGNYANEQTGKYYSFIYNSSGSHLITEYDTFSDTISLVLQGSFLNFQEYELINGVGIVAGNLLYWTDGFNPPRGIEIDKAKTGTYYTDSVSISLSKPPPQELITASYGNDSSVLTASNRLKNQLFQFRYLYVYEDGSRSAWSSCSKLPYPALEIESSVDTASYKNNNIILSFDAGSKFVKSIEIAAQVKGVSSASGTQDWFSILTVDRETVLSNPLYLYNATTNTAIYAFYNNELYQSVDILEIDLPYDFIPLKSKTLEVINGNVLVIGNNLEGYDNIDIAISLDVDYQLESNDRLAVDFVEINTTEHTQLFTGIPVAGDEISYQWEAFNIDTATWNTFSTSYVVTEDTSGSLYDTLVLYGAAVQAETEAQVGYEPITFIDVTASGAGFFVNFFESGGAYFTNVSIDLGARFSNAIPAYKTNSKYQFGLVYYDEFNRSSYVQLSDQSAVSTKSWGEVEGKHPVISWSVSSTAPDWATKYQWVRTEQLSHFKFLFTPSSSIALSSDGNYYELTVSSISGTIPNSILSYDYSPGDRCTIHKQTDTWVSGYDVEIVGYDVDTNKLTIQKGADLVTGTNITLIEIYTPKTRSNSSTDQFFYEFGESYDILPGGYHQGPLQNQTSLLPASGLFSDGDIYDKGRVYLFEGQINLEDPNFSDFYISNFSANGRTNIFAPQAKQLTLPTDIRFSDTYVPNTNINGLSRFYGDAYETYDRVNGSIQKLAVRDNYLMTFQELKTGYIPILQSIIEDQGGGVDNNVAISNKLLNKIRYFAGDYGIGTHPESFARFAGTMYFADPNRGQILKLAGGLQPIGVIGMDSYFTSKLTELKTKVNGKVFGSYDPYNDEYILAFRQQTSTQTFDQTISFSESTNRWMTFYSFLPENGGYIFNQYITHRNGQLWKHNVNPAYNSFYGATWTSIVDLVYNASPTLIKTFIGVIEQASTPWVPVAVTTSRGQTSELSSDNFTEKEGVYFASLLRAITADPESLYFGDDLKGNWIKISTAMGVTGKQTLLSLDVRHIPSYQGIK